MSAFVSTTIRAPSPVPFSVSVRVNFTFRTARSADRGTPGMVVTRPFSSSV